MEYQGKNVLVVGLGISGIGAAKLLHLGGAHVILFDGNDKLTKEEVEKKLPEGMEAEIYTGFLPKAAEEKTELVIVSPGVPTDTEFIQSFRDRGIEIWGEIELAYRASKGRLIAITGTNGKTTTTALAGQIVKDCVGNAVVSQPIGSAFVVGNIGTPYTLEADQTADDSVTVAEISSFQLETIHTFQPSVSAILNITPDHLNRHHTMENYVAVKESIAKNQDKSSRCILNYEDAYTKAFGERTSAEPFYFSSARKLEKGIYLDGDDIYLAEDENKEPVRVLNIHEMKLLGTHNVENVMAAIALTWSIGIPLERIVSTVKEFKAVEHRIEYVATKKGVDYYNDSKGTNPDAAIKGIQAMNRPTVLIGGGYDKQSEYDEWIEAFDGKVKWLVLLGQTKEKIAQCARAHGFTNIIMAESLEEVVDICAQKAQAGDAVLLSPACASWGMFPNYEVRGKIFKELVHKLED
ncbi:MAG: UDP-N-acetylmuramoyl-L-alanine--D-glutamate ligase [Lachnospiraceae bacterium]|nr:UDP-N-acetylmuramoyl-L-alanine--D-glutamate ligase [Lachnospiraceae bacterium]